MRGVMREHLWVVVLSAWVLIVGGCGYRFQGATTPEATIEVPLFENRTIETGIEALITDRVLDELRRTPGWRVVAPGQGHYVLRGTVAEFISDPQFISAKRHLAQEHRARLVLSVALRDRKSGKVVWTVGSLRSFADYPVGNDVLANEREKRLAIASIAEELAARIRVHIQDAW
jgi:outer membrane lipopolysaccharide assembly protein LptE/RlpB